MTNDQINRSFLQSIHTKVKARILDEIASRYGITPDGAFNEVTDSEAEHILDYLTGSVRTATSLLMKRVAV